MTNLLYVILTLNTLSHLLALVLDSERENPLFRSPVGKNPTHVLDIGTGKGNWAMYVKRESPPCPVPERNYTNITLILVMLPTCSHLVSSKPHISTRW